MKKRLALTALLCGLALLSGCVAAPAQDAPSTATTAAQDTTTTAAPTADDAWRLTVNGQDISGGKALAWNEEYRYVQLPLIPILEKRGADITYTDEHTAVIAIDGYTYMLNTADGTLFLPDDANTGNTGMQITNDDPHFSVNLFQVSPGGGHPVAYGTADGIFWVGSDCVSLLWSMLNLRMKIHPDTREAVITHETLCSVPRIHAPAE